MNHYLDAELSGVTLEEAKAFARLFEKRALAMEEYALKLDLHAFDREVAELNDD